MSEYVHVVTGLEMGWDCVCGVFTEYDDAVMSCFHDDTLSFAEKIEAVEGGDTSYVIHTKRLMK